VIIKISLTLEILQKTGYSKTLNEGVGEGRGCRFNFGCHALSGWGGWSAKWYEKVSEKIVNMLNC